MCKRQTYWSICPVPWLVSPGYFTVTWKVHTGKLTVDICNYGKFSRFTSTKNIKNKNRKCVDYTVFLWGSVKTHLSVLWVALWGSLNANLSVLGVALWGSAKTHLSVLWVALWGSVKTHLSVLWVTLTGSVKTHLSVLSVTLTGSVKTNLFSPANDPLRHS